jgi:hypothetical protein
VSRSPLAPALAALLCVVAACGGDPVPSRALEMGASVGPLAFEDLDGRAVPVRDHGDHAATVLWFWSATCDCVPGCEERIRALLRDYAPRRVRFVAVDPSESDSPDEIRALLGRMKSPYAVLRDPGGRETRRLGVLTSASVVILDGEGRLRFRGAFDDDLERPTVAHARHALDAVLSGEAVAVAEPPSYGCLYPGM